MTAVFGKTPESKLNLFLSRLLLSAGSARRAPEEAGGDRATRGGGRRSGAGRGAPGGRGVGKRKWSWAGCRARGRRSRRWSAAHRRAGAREPPLSGKRGQDSSRDRTRGAGDLGHAPRICRWDGQSTVTAPEEVEVGGSLSVLPLGGD